MNHNTKLVSIIMPVYNRSKLIIKTLEAILNQTYPNWECILVDDHSTDDTYLIIEEYIAQDNRFTLYKRPDHLKKGANNCRNYGFLKSQGALINWFDSDDVMVPTFLAKKVESIGESSINICGYYYTDINLNITNEFVPFHSDNLIRDYALWKLKLITNCVLFSRNFLVGKTLFNEELSRGQETELFLRIFQNVQPKDLTVVADHLFYYVKHEGSISNSISKNSLSFLTSRLVVNRLLVSQFEADRDVLKVAYFQAFWDMVYCKVYRQKAILKDYFPLAKKITAGINDFRYLIPIYLLLLPIPKIHAIAIIVKKALKV